jgi:cholesterol transport system auxiliary component
LYNLTPKSIFSGDLPKVEAQIVVAEPLAAGGLDSNRIALRPTSTELKYYARARWTERAPKMVQTLLVESLENSRRIVSVGRQAIGLRSDYDLKTELREFQAEYFGGVGENPNIRVRLNVKIIAQPRQTIIASRSFESYLPAPGSDISSIVVGFDEALGKVLKNTVKWTLVTVADRDARR